MAIYIDIYKGQLSGDCGTFGSWDFGKVEEEKEMVIQIRSVR